MILSMSFLKTLQLFVQLKPVEMVCVYGTKASLVGFLPIKMCVNILGAVTKSLF